MFFPLSGRHNFNIVFQNTLKSSCFRKMFKPHDCIPVHPQCFICDILSFDIYHYGTSNSHNSLTWFILWNYFRNLGNHPELVVKFVLLAMTGTWDYRYLNDCFVGGVHVSANVFGSEQILAGIWQLGWLAHCHLHNTPNMQSARIRKQAGCS